MNKILLLILIVFLTAGTCYSQTYVPTGKGWKYTPNGQIDSFQVLRFLKINGEVVKFTAPTIGQIIRKDADGVWKNMTASSVAYDSIRFSKTNGFLRLYKDGAVALYDTLDGRYQLITVVNDSIHAIRTAIPTGIMLKSVYDIANIGGQIVNTTTSQTLTNKILTNPTITNFTLSNHTHAGTTQGGLLNSDVIVQGATNLFSPFTYASGNYTLASGYIGIGGVPLFPLDIFGSARIQQLTLSTSLTLGSTTVTGIQIGTGTNNYLATKNYVDDQIVTAGGYTDEKSQDAIGTILDDGTIGDVVFTYDDAGNKISADVENDSHNHTGSTISGLSVSNFTSQNISNWTNNSGYVGSTYALTGDLTGTLASPSITGNAVTFAKIQTIPTSTLLGRTTAGTGNVESLSVVNVQGLLGLGSSAYTSAGDYSASTHDHSGIYQPLDGDLSAVAGLATTGYLKRTGTNAWSLDNTLTQYTDALARGSISLTTTGTSGASSYNPTTGVLNIPSYAGGGSSMTYPSAGIAFSTGSSWGASIPDASAWWTQAYNWGDHSTQGYLKAITKAMVEAQLTGTIGSHNHTGTYQPLATVLTNTTAPYTTAEQTKLSGIAVGATNVTNTSQLTNGAGFITGITSGNVTTALGFTPYNATNPSNYIAIAGARTAVSLTTTGTTGVATYNSTTGVLNVPNYVAGTGMASLNGLTGSIQTLATPIIGGGVYPTWTSSGTSHTLNIPLATDNTSVTAGLVSGTSASAWNAKQATLTALDDNANGITYFPMFYNYTNFTSSKQFGISTNKFAWMPSTGLLTIDNLNLHGTGTAKPKLYLSGGQGTVGQVLRTEGSGGGIYWSSDVSSVSALTITSQGTDLTSTVANGTSTPVITLNVPTASSTNRGVLTAVDWSTFNNKLATNGSASQLINFPTFNQNTTGTAQSATTLTAQYINWNATSGGTSIANKPFVPNITVQILSSPALWDTSLGVNADITLSTTNTTITLTNLVAGTTGNLTVYGQAGVVSPKITVITYRVGSSTESTNYMSSTIKEPNTNNIMKTSGSQTFDIFSWYFDGNQVFWNGTLGYNF